MFEIDTAGFFRDLEEFLAAQTPAAPLLPIDRAARVLPQEWRRTDAFWRFGGVNVTSAEIAKFLAGVLHILERDGWHQGFYQDYRTGARCIRGALIDAEKAGYGDFDASCVAQRVLDLLMRSAPGVRSEAIEGWNDAAGRTSAEVQALVRDGIEFARLYGPPPNATDRVGR
ncbi:hypothetical protein [Streptomyces syringium]|uniref:DUF6197 family protein n=1 Tax=Streptomyces syringium TaxID=76729 RepID=UPI0037CF281F